MARRSLESGSEDRGGPLLLSKPSPKWQRGKINRKTARGIPMSHTWEPKYPRVPLAFRSIETSSRGTLEGTLINPRSTVVNSIKVLRAQNFVSGYFS